MLSLMGLAAQIGAMSDFNAQKLAVVTASAGTLGLAAPWLAQLTNQCITNDSPVNLENAHYTENERTAMFAMLYSLSGLILGAVVGAAVNDNSMSAVISAPAGAVIFGLTATAIAKYGYAERVDDSNYQALRDQTAVVINGNPV